MKESEEHAITYNEALKGHKHKFEILSILHVDNPNSPVKMPEQTYEESYNKKDNKIIDTYDFIQRSLRGLNLIYWRNFNE